MNGKTYIFPGHDKPITREEWLNEGNEQGTQNLKTDSDLREKRPDNAPQQS